MLCALKYGTFFLFAGEGDGDPRTEGPARQRAPPGLSTAVIAVGFCVPRRAWPTGG